MARVAVVAGYGPSLVRFRGHLLGELVRLGHTVIAIAPDDSGTVQSDLAELGVDFRAVGLSRAGLNPFSDLGYTRSLVNIFRTFRPDLILPYTIKPVIFGSLASRLARCGRVYAMITGLGFAFGEESGFAGRLARALYRLALRTNEKVFLQNPDDLRDLLRFGCLEDASQAVLIPGSGIDLTEYPQVPMSTGNPKFLLIARLLKEKGVREYVAAARLLKASNANLEFHLVGWLDSNPSAVSESELVEWVSEGLIEYHGFLDDVRPLLAQSTIFVLPSYYREGVPRTLLEAMATGRPIVTCNTPGCRETVVDGVNGYLVPPRDPEALAASMRSIAENPKLAGEMGAASRQLAEKKFDVRIVTRVVLEAMDLC